MSFPVRQNSTHKVVVGPVVAVGDGFTPVTTLALSTADEAEVILHDNGTVVDISGYTFAAITTADGYYHLTLQSGITSTIGHMTVVINDDSLCLPVKADFVIIEEAIYDAFYASGAEAPLKPTTAGRTLDVTATGAAGIDWGNIENKTTANDLSATDIQLCDTVTTNTDMRGTDNAALASVVGALTDAAAAGDPTTADTVMQYVKQLINILVGTDGVTTFPAEAAPANAVSLAEVIRAIHADVTGLNGSAMRGTDSAALASVCTEARLSELDAATSGKMANQVDIIEADTTSLNDTKIPDTISLANINAECDTALTDYAGFKASVTGTSDSGTTTTMVDAARTEADTDYWKGSWIRFTSGTLNGQVRLITAFTPSTDTITFSPATTVAVGTHTYDIVPAGYIDLVNTVTTNTDMRGTDSAALASVCTEARLAELDAANLPADIDAILTDTGTTLDTKINTIDTNVDAILVDTNELQGDWTNGGRLDLIIDAILVDTGTTLDTKINTIDTNVDAILVDTNELQGDWTNGGRLDLIIDAILVDTGTTIPGTITTLQADTDDIQTRLPAALVGGRMDADVGAISTSTDAADKLEASAEVMIIGTVDTVTNTHTPTTTEFQADDITEATADHYNGRIVVFTSGVLIGQATDITDYSAVGGIGQFTVTALTEAPSNNDTFVIV